MDEIAQVVKSGEVCIQTLLSRRGRKSGDPNDWKGGMVLTVKTLPRVEEFIQSLGNGSVVDVGTVGRYWTPIIGKLEAYNIQPIPNQQSEDGSVITFDMLGKPLISVDAEGRERYPVINLSFLRLKGISEGAGVSFGIKGVYSLDELRKMKDKIVAAQRRFYVEYLRPVDLLVTVSTQEVQF